MFIACLFQIASQHASTVGTAGSKSSKSMAALNNAVRHATDGFIGILDMFGFEDPKVSCLVLFTVFKESWIQIHFIHSFSIVLTTGPKPPPKRCLHTVRSKASSFK